MTSWLTWPIDWLVRRISHQNVEKLKRELGDARYIDVDRWAGLNNIDKKEAEQELESAVKSGVLQKAYLYVGHDSPINFLVPEHLLDQSIKLSDIGFFDEDEDREIVVSRVRSRAVYVAATDEADHYVHAA